MIDSDALSLNVSHSLRLIFLAPGFSPVEAGCGDMSRFNGFPPGVETAEAVELVKRLTTTGLKPGANERLYRSLYISSSFTSNDFGCGFAALGNVQASGPHQFICENWNWSDRQAKALGASE